jgi:hypothetical protein
VVEILLVFLFTCNILTGLQDMDQNGVSAEADESLALSSYEVYIKGKIDSYCYIILYDQCRVTHTLLTLYD